MATDKDFIQKNVVIVASCLWVDGNTYEARATIEHEAMMRMTADGARDLTRALLEASAMEVSRKIGAVIV